ncbi:PREDICTED: stromal interaction molecule homolog isoform X2 [Nicrophorus vespilloides]|uniref:Stromal interaction molecule homolog isoform X2 n=1 Tax=Nicrophorus vespilloides TaxID=110193 RepID=A0ABM1NHB7_NICVS|nr:PREDICTED: stromal interaction molecule homolog isoform X2 [Nicrophorus vespilloides]
MLKMNSNRLIFWLIFTIYWCNGHTTKDEPDKLKNDNENKYRMNREKSTYTMLSESINQAVNNENLHETCNNDDFTCLAMASNDKLGLEAIRALHQQLDDDANGNIDLSETGDFLREDLKLDSGYEKRQKVFHFNDDMHISVKELWEAWLRSEVHNWTIEQTTDWLTVCVELPQYVDHFIRHRVTGANLPRLAANNMHYLSMLGIKDPIHKQKISLKAMDVVLFGPPKDSQHYWKDFTLITLIIIGGIGSWYALQQNNKFKRKFNRMNRDLEGLETLQKELEEARLAKENVASEQRDLHKSNSDLEVTELKAEIEMLRTELQIAEGELKDRCWSPPPGLQQWLQLTHEIENKAYIKKKISAEKQLQQAREACEKLRKKRSSLVGAFVSTHGKSIDEVDRSIVEARTSLSEVTQELQERAHRWKQVELLCGFNVISNNGLQYLESILYRNLNGRAFALRGPMEINQTQWKEVDSSGSEASKQEEDTTEKPIKFIVGSESEEIPVAARNISVRSVSNNSIVSSSKPTGAINRSKSHDSNISEISYRPKAVQGEILLENTRPQAAKPKVIKETACAEDDVYSTDSSVVDDDVKKKKRKLFGFGKKSKAKD